MMSAREKALRRQKRRRFKIRQTTNCHYLVVPKKTNQYMYLHLVDLKTSATLVSVSTRDIAQRKFNKELAGQLGTLFADKIKAKLNTLPKIVYDCGSYAYHGCIKEAADAARQAGLIF